MQIGATSVSYATEFPCIWMDTDVADKFDTGRIWLSDNPEVSSGMAFCIIPRCPNIFSGLHCQSMVTLIIHVIFGQSVLHPTFRRAHLGHNVCEATSSVRNKRKQTFGPKGPWPSVGAD